MNTSKQEEYRAEFAEIPYGKLKARFEELGVGDAFRGGKKKEELIDEAIKQLIKKEGEAKESTIEDALDEVNVEKDDEELVEADGDEVPVPNGRPKNLSDKDLQKNLHNIELLLLSATPKTRKELIDKRDLLESWID